MEKRVYWLIRPEGQKHGIAKVELSEASSSGQALEVFFAKETIVGDMLAAQCIAVEAVPVSFYYDENGQPVVSELR